MQELKTSPPKVTDYVDYHQFLRDYYEFKKQEHRRFSFRRFAQLSRIKSSNYLMLVMNRRRKLLPATARRVAEAMKLSRAETDFFLSLVKQERARTDEDREQVERDKRVALQKILRSEIPAKHKEYLRHWYYSLVREMAFLADFRADPVWIVHRLRGLVSEEQAASAIHLLLDLGLWRREGSKIVVRDLYLDTGPEDRSFGEVQVTALHRETLVAWSKVIEATPKSERELGLLNIPIHSEKIPELKLRIQKFQDEIVGWLQDEKAATQIVQLGTYLIPITRGES